MPRAKKPKPVHVGPRERPLLLSGSMVRLAIAGVKSQTRRPFRIGHVWPDHCPQGVPNDLLWVKETWQDGPAGPIYRATDAMAAEKWRSSRFLPKIHSRLWLRILRTWQQRLDAITEAQAIAEGALAWWEEVEEADRPLIEKVSTFRFGGVCAQGIFSCLWDLTYGKQQGQGWRAQPWVWVIEFERALVVQPEAV